MGVGAHASADGSLDAASQALPVSRTPFSVDVDECEPLIPPTNLEKLSSRFGHAWASARAVGSRIADTVPSAATPICQRTKKLAREGCISTAACRWLLFGACLLLVGVVVGASPWWYPCLLWRPSSTSFVSTGPGVDPETYLITNQSAFANAPIPKIIHQTWKDDSIPEKWRAARDSCIQKHPDFQYMLWTDEGARKLIADMGQEFPALPGTFDSYRHGIQRADVVRYALLYKYGGIYIDLDIECRAPLDFLLRYPFVMPATRPVGFSQDFLVAAPGHPFLRRMLEALPRWNVHLVTKYPTVMFSTGPMFVTLQACFYRLRRSLWVLPDEMYGKYVKSPRQLFTHLYGSSWHGDDARSILWLLRHPVTLIGAISVGWILGAYRYWQLYRTARALATEADPGLLKIC